MIEKRYLYKRHNVYWVRVRVPNNLRNIIGKTELNKFINIFNIQIQNLINKDYLEKDVSRRTELTYYLLFGFHL